MIRAIIFDCYGVLTTDGWWPFKKKHFGHDPNLEQQASDLNRQADAGLTTHANLVQTLAKWAHITPEEVWNAIHSNVADDELFGYIQEHLKPHFKIGLLSNTGANRLPELFTPEQINLFEATSLSYDTGYVKPDPRAYETIAARLDVLPEECIFVDDQERFCTAARGEGMQAIVYKNYEQFVPELEAALRDRSS